MNQNKQIKCPKCDKFVWAVNGEFAKFSMFTFLVQLLIMTVMYAIIKIFFLKPNLVTILCFYLCLWFVINHLPLYIHKFKKKPNELETIFPHCPKCKDEILEI